MLIHNTLAILFSIISPFILIINQKHPLMFLRSLTTEAMGTGGLRAYSLS